MSLDRVPGKANLYIGGLISLRRYEALKKANITHVVSVLRPPLDQDLFRPYAHHVVEVDDADEENIIQHFAASNAFIDDGLREGGGVLVHCAMGKSRSTTILIAYLLHASMRAFVSPPSPSKGWEQLGPISRESFLTNSPLNPTSALNLIRESRSFVEPNSGFMSQLELYHRMGCPDDLDSQPQYQRWLYQCAVEESNSRGMAPEVKDVYFGDEADTGRVAEEVTKAGGGGGGESGNEEGDGGLSGHKSNQLTDTGLTATTGDPRQQDITYRCRRCRTQLAISQYTVPHDPGQSSATKPSLPSSSAKQGKQPHQQQQSQKQPCAHIFLQPLSWMRPELEQGNLSGRLECPNAKCRTVVGRYAWQGMQCSCAQWVVPGLGLGRAKVDEVRSGSKNVLMLQGGNANPGGGGAGGGGVGAKEKM